MAKWHVEQECAHLFLNKPEEPIGWVIKDQDGRRFMGPELDGMRGVWITLDRAAADTKCAELNGGG